MTTTPLEAYTEFLRGKAQTAKADGFTVTLPALRVPSGEQQAEGELHPSLSVEVA